MISTDELAAERPKLFAVAYRMLGSPSDADDAVQEAFARWQRVDEGTVRDPHAWLVTVVTRVAVDRLRALKIERERYVGHWIPEPIVDDVAAQPERHAERADEISVAFLHVLERLAPDERAAFLLHDAFGYPHVEIAAVLERSEVAIRQTVHRARERLRRERPRFAVDPQAAHALVERFIVALENGDEAGIRAALAEDVSEVADGGGVIHAGLKTVEGRDRVLRLFLGLHRKHWRHMRLERAHVGGGPGFIVRNEDGTAYGVVALDVRDAQIRAVHIIVAPDKVARALARLR